MAQQQFAQPSFAPRDTYSKVELSISCTNLKDLDHFSKSDPCVFIFEKHGTGWTKLGRTEVIDNNLNPKFAKTFLLEYRFEEIQTIRFVVYDVDNKVRVDDIKRHDFIGEMECTLADIVTGGQLYKRTLRMKGASRGQIIIQAEEVQDSKYNIHMQLAANKLDKKDFFGKSDPLVEISKAQEGGTFTVVYRSQPIMKTLNPRWPEFVISIQKLCSGDWDRTIRISAWDWNRSGDHDFIGSCTTTLREIVPEKGGQVYNLNLVNPELKKKKKKYTNSGILNFVSVKATPLHSFMDYVKGGCEISLLAAIDFTASNGKPHLPSSLHYNNPYQDNEYVQAIKSVASVLAPYDSDQLIPTFGFGARVPPDGQVSHCFPLNFNYQKPDVYGVQGILDAYHYTLSQVEFYGPTNFSTFLDKAIEYATGGVSQEAQSYHILLVITDGVISDMARTVDRIVTASKLPLSIVIVGVGAADFSNMETLDADDNPLRNQYGEKMERDIVQFVPLRAFQSKSGANFSLARETLAEIPDQFLSYMKTHGIRPNPPPLKKQQSGYINPPGGPPQAGQGSYPSAPYPATGPPGPQYQSSVPPYPQGPPGAPQYQQGPPGAPPYQQGTPSAPPYQQGPPGAPPYQQGTPSAPPYQQGTPSAPPYQQGTPSAPPYPI